MKKIYENVVLFLTGGCLYAIVEIVWRLLLGRSPTHWSMFIVGGIAFLLVGAINECLPWDTPFWKQMLIGDAMILAVEFIFGCILNIWLKLGVWDYSNMLCNIWGQVCLPFAVAWLALAAVAIVLDDYMRYWLFGEERPMYCWK